jgi:hypothetical protein
MGTSKNRLLAIYLYFAISPSQEQSATEVSENFKIYPALSKRGRAYRLNEYFHIDLYIIL